DGDVVSLTPDGVSFVRADTGEPVEHDVLEVDWDDDVAERSGYETFMLKEIYEQPEGVAETIGDRVRHGHLVLEGLGMTEDELRDLRRIVLVACGSAYHAGVVGRYAIEEWARVPVEPDVASEWIYRNPVVDPGTLVIGISQSGETRDTIQAMKLAREKGARTVAITNMMGSQITREVDSVIYTRTGLEVGVAASKTFTAQIALLEEGTPVVVVATRSHVYDKIVSNIQETRARGAYVIAIASDGHEDIQHHADDVIYVPKSPAFLQAALAILPLQLLAYRIARLRGLNVDQPRNLAKTVTVE